MLFMSLFLIFSPSFHFCGCKGTYFYYMYCIFLLYLFYFATFAAQKVEICQERDANNR